MFRTHVYSRPFAIMERNPPAFHPIIDADGTSHAIILLQYTKSVCTDAKLNSGTVLALNLYGLGTCTHHHGTR